jgi:hypothetical protein
MFEVDGAHPGHQFMLWQHLLVVGLVSHAVTHLAIQESLGPIKYASTKQHLSGIVQHEERPVEFPNVRVLSCSEITSYQDFQWFFSRAPLLSHVGVDYSHGNIPLGTACDPPTPFTSVESLAICCSPFHLGHMLRVCNQMRDLELHVLEYYHEEWVDGMMKSPQ